MPNLTISDLFPQTSRILLTGGGKGFLDRVGAEVAKQIVFDILMGENLRWKTEPLTQRRIAEVCGAMLALFVRGWTQVENFTSVMSEMALKQIAESKKSDNISTWPAQWLIGLTGKSMVNVLRSNPELFLEYTFQFETALEEAATKNIADLGDLRMALGFAENKQERIVELRWKEIMRLTTAIGSATLAIRGSEKSIYGKLFERLVLGSVLTILGFERVDPITNTKTEKVFWLNDRTKERECDAMVILRPGKVARFDIGFIGEGNSEISKDKLSRYNSEIEAAGEVHQSNTFILVDRLPSRSKKTKAAAEKIGAELLQMGYQYWPSELARLMGHRLGFTHELQDIPDEEIFDYLEKKLQPIPVEDFVKGVPAEDLGDQDDLDEAEPQVPLPDDEDAE